jgi:hypothetical protein
MFGAGGVGKVARARLIPSGLDVMKPGDMPTLRPVTIPAEPTKGVLVGEPYGPPEAVTLRPPPVKMAPESLPAAGERSALPYPDYAGDGFTYKAASEAPDILRRDGKPFQSEAGAKAAMTREGVTDYEVVQVDDGFVARQKQTQGKEFRPEDAPPVSELDRIRLQVKAEDEARRQGATSLPKIEMGKVYPGRQEPPAAAPARPQGEISPNQEREKPEHHNNA